MSVSRLRLQTATDELQRVQKIFPDPLFNQLIISSFSPIFWLALHFIGIVVYCCLSHSIQSGDYTLCNFLFQRTSSLTRNVIVSVLPLLFKISIVSPLIIPLGTQLAINDEWRKIKGEDIQSGTHVASIKLAQNSVMAVPIKRIGRFALLTNLQYLFSQIIVNCGVSQSLPATVPVCKTNDPVSEWVQAEDIEVLSGIRTVHWTVFYGTPVAKSINYIVVGEWSW